MRCDGALLKAFPELKKHAGLDEVLDEGDISAGAEWTSESSITSEPQAHMQPVAIEVTTPPMSIRANDATRPTLTINQNSVIQSEEGHPRRRKAAYKETLEKWLAPQEASTLQNMGHAAIAEAFKSYCAAEKQEALQLLPKRLRAMHNIILTHIKRRPKAEKPAR